MTQTPASNLPTLTLVGSSDAAACEITADGPVCAPAPAAPSAVDAEAAADLAARFKALADPNRLRLLSLVAASSNAEACVCDLTEPLDLGQPTVSHHLKVLVDAGFLTREKRGTWAYYSVVPGALEAVDTDLRGLVAAT